MDIKEFITQYEKGTVYVSPGVEYNLKDVLNASYRAFNGKFENGKDSTGFEKIFYNMGWVIYRTLFYASNIDTKDMNMRSTNGQGIPLIGLVRTAVHSHLNRTGFGRFLEDLRSDVCAFGCGMVKIVDGQLKMVDLRNIIRPAHIENLQDSGLAERQYFTYEQMLAMKKNWSKEAWKEVENVWTELKKQGRYDFTCYEFWTVDEYEKDGKVHKLCKLYLDKSVLMPKDLKDPESWDPNYLLDTYITPYKKKRRTALLRKKYGTYEELYPYKQANLMRVKGRWLPFGVFELISGLQEHYNEKWNLYRKKDILDLKGIFKHVKGNTGKSVEQQYIDAMETGAMIDLEQGEDIERLIIDTKTSELIMDIDKLFEIARQIVGVTSQGTGEDMPADTTATLAVINKQTQQTTYDYVIEQLSHFLVELFEDFYLDEILDELTEEEWVAIVGDPVELKELQETFVTNMINEKVTEAMKRGFYPTQQEVDAMKEGVATELDKMHGDMRFIQLKKSMLKNIDYYLEFFVNNERFDKNVQIKNLLSLMADPNLSGSREKLEQELLDLMGLDGKRYMKSEEERVMELGKMAIEKGLVQPGGGAPMPNGGQMPGPEMASANRMM